MSDNTIGCYDPLCACNTKPQEPCRDPRCNGGRIYHPWMSYCCLAEPRGVVMVEMMTEALGSCSACGRESFFGREVDHCPTCG
jgi:hypothetical protein